MYLGIHPVPPQTRRKFLQDLTESLGHVVRHVVHSLQHGVREEAIRSKKGFHRWLKPFALHANLSWSQCSVTTVLTGKISWCPVKNKTAEYVHLQHIDVVAKCLQGHFKHDFLGQVAVPLKDHVAFN